MRLLSFSAVFCTGLAVGAAAMWFAPTLFKRHAPYAGQNERSVSSLSADDVRQLEEGRGWGLAKPAELNGYPGPLHILELADDLDLDAQQSEAVRKSYDAMRGRAKRFGKALVEAESALDRAFERGGLDAATLTERLQHAERIRAALREVHLAAHLEVTPLLTDKQRERYAALRGYGANGHGGH